MQIGLKLWSSNTDYYLHEAMRLFDRGVFDYIELYIVPGTVNTIKEWANLPIPYILHNAHFAHGFNLASHEKKSANYEIFQQTKLFAEVLNPQYIIFHGGIDGSIEETALQLHGFQDSRVLIENKPYKALPNRMNGEVCRGATVDELQKVVDIVHCGVCLDFGHAVCSANTQGLNPYHFIKQLNDKFSPKMYHLSDVKDMTTEFDSHPHLGEGKLDIAYLCKHVLPGDALLSIETNKNNSECLDDFEEDVRWLRNLL